MPHTQTVEILTEDRLYNQAAELFISTARDSVFKRGIFTVALAGGSTPRKLYSILAQQDAGTIPWNQVLIFFGDERCVPPDDIQSNYKMAEETLFSKIDIPRQNIHRIKGEIDPETAAREYEEEIRRSLQSGEKGMPRFDMILLGMGEDGHTASLFPGSDALKSSRLVAGVYVPKLNAARITLTPVILKAARLICVLVVGENKSRALKEVLSGPHKPEILPAQVIREAECDVVWLIDVSAASGL